MKYQKPVSRNLSAINVAEGACASGTSVLGCTDGGANATSYCSAGTGVFSIAPSCGGPGNVADTCTPTGSNAAP